MRIRRLFGSRRGAEAVEFALISPILFILLIGIMDFAWFFCHQLLMDQCTERTARSAAIQIVNDDATNANATWATTGADCWEDFGLPTKSDPGFAMELKQTSGLWLVHATGSMAYDSLLGVGGVSNDINAGAVSVSWSPLPTTITSTAVKYASDQNLSDALDVAAP